MEQFGQLKVSNVADDDDGNPNKEQENQPEEPKEPANTKGNLSSIIPTCGIIRLNDYLLGP